MSRSENDWLAAHPPGSEVRAAIYARRSKGKHDQYSPREQVERCRELCEQRDWTARYVVVEDDARADYEMRPKWLVLLLRAAAENFDVLVPWKTDRWARSLWDTLRTERFLARHGIAYTSVTEPFDTTTPYGRYAFRSIANVAELERDLISERVSLGWASKNRQHKWPNHRTPLGYTTLKDYTLVPCPEDIPTIELVWDKYCRLKSGPAVAEELNHEGVETKHGGKWEARLVYAATDNPLYVGRWSRGGLDEYDPDLRIMPDEEFEAMQRIRRRKHIDRSPMSAQRKRKAIRRVYSQYFQQLELEATQEKAAYVDELEASQARRIDPAVLQRILGTFREPAEDWTKDEEKLKRIRRERERRTKRWRTALAEILTM